MCVLEQNARSEEMRAAVHASSTLLLVSSRVCFKCVLCFNDVLCVDC